MKKSLSRVVHRDFFIIKVSFPFSFFHFPGFRAHMLSMEDTEWRAVDMVEKMEEKMLRKSFANTKKEEIRALLDEAFNVTAKRTP